MKYISLSVLAGFVLPFSGAAQPSVIAPADTHWYDRATDPYRPSTLPPVSMANSTRLGDLIRAGKLYLSLQDAIALALENNLDVELQRYAPAIAESDLLRAKGGSAVLRGIPYTVNLLPQGIGGPASPLLNIPASGITPTTSVPTNIIEIAAIVPGTTSAQISTPFSTGPEVPIFDPAVVGNLIWQHTTTPETNTLLAGTNALAARSLTGSLGVEKGFSLGTQIGLTFNSNSQNTNSLRSAYNPYNTSALGLNLVQPLLRGFGPAVNRRFIRIASNNQQVSELVFRQQVIETVSGVIRLYFDLVSLIEDAGVKRQTLGLAEQLYADNRTKVEQGTLAPIELLRAQAQVAASQQDLANSEGFELQQELIMKTVITRRGTADPVLREARIVATTPNEVPATEDVRPVQDLVMQAFANRPEIEEARLQIANSRISLKGSRNALLPELNLVGIAQNTGLAGQANPLAVAGGSGGSTFTPGPDPAFTGGFGSALGQILRRDNPTYGGGIQLNLPLKNRIAQGDYARDEIAMRQTEIRLQQLENQVRLEVEGALIASHRARAAYDAALQARKLQEQSLQIEMEKYANGLSTNFLVMQYQSYVAQARSTEVAAEGAYVKARAALERAAGETLLNHNITLEDVLRGRLSTPPSPLPAP